MAAKHQIPDSAWISGVYDDRAAIGRDSMWFTEHLGVEWDLYVEDGLGRAAQAGFRAADGTQFFLQYLFEAPMRGLTAIGVLVDASGVGVDRALETLGLTSSALRWLHPTVELTNHSLYGQDDHGRRYLISHFPCRADAVDRMRNLETAVHKQDYVVEPLKPSQLALAFDDQCRTDPKVVSVTPSGSACVALTEVGRTGRATE